MLLDVMFVIPIDDGSESGLLCFVAESGVLRMVGSVAVGFLMLGRLRNQDIVAWWPLNHHGGTGSVTHFNRSQKPERLIKGRSLNEKRCRQKQMTERVTVARVHG
jgi:hypothetical protein